MRFASWLEPLALPGREHEMRALGGESLGHRKADADAAAGDHGNFPAEIRDPRILPALFQRFFYRFIGGVATHVQAKDARTSRPSQANVLASHD